MLTAEEFYQRNGGEDRVRAKLRGGTVAQQDARVAAALTSAIDEAISEMSAGRDRGRIASLTSDTAPDILKLHLADAAWYHLFKVMDVVTEETLARHAGAMAWYRRVQSGKADLLLTPQVAEDRTHQLPMHNRSSGTRMVGSELFKVRL
ncbi:MAG: phage protein Gp36 family protein [Acidobacteriota bacterium]